jgi:LemA protein
MLMIGIGIFFILLVGIAVATSISIYNGIVMLKNQVDRAWANIDVILKQRYDEIPQLIEVLEQTAQYEKSVIQKVMDARAQYGSARSPDEKVSASQEMSFALKGIFAIGEAYPELKSNANFTHLQNRLSALEGQLTDRREVYNEAVTNWNTRIAQFPEILFRSFMNLQERMLFQVTEQEKARPKLKMNLGV